MKFFACNALLLIGLTAATPALAQDWRVAAMAGEKPNRSVYLLDATSIARSGDTVNFTTQSIFEQVTDSRDFDKSITRRRGDCATMSSAIVTNSYYRSGALSNDDTIQGDSLPHRAGTIMYGVLEQACGKKPLETGSIGNPEVAVRNYFAK